ncbi:hypothetical protein B0H17DRAFT_1182514 [Mycena rosella]|uniref:Uncharacterized protein n=1 Tax=Mycena rosella TaxID=1033263 RepID=A0AAD7G8C0_MYCRO|nr:hypothetical protein B0H17DRAFT_1182514 [Mycena rosella]
MSTSHKYGFVTNARNITLDDYDALPDATYRDKIEDVVERAIKSEHVQALLAPRGSIWPMDIFAAARVALDRDPEATPNGLYFTAVSTVICHALGALRSPTHPAPVPELSPEDRRALQKRVVSNVHRCPRHPLRVQVLRHMHLKWTLSMSTGRAGSGYASDESSEEDELELVLIAEDA